MRNKFKLLLLVLLITNNTLYSQSNQKLQTEGYILDPIAKLIFKEVKHHLSIAEQNEIAKGTGFKLNKSKTKLVYDGIALSTDVFFVDLNEDGIDEVSIYYSGSEDGELTYFGPGGASHLFSKNKAGHYAGIMVNQENSNLVSSPAYGYFFIIDHKTNGWYDISFEGPGMETNQWVFNGRGYSHYRNYPTESFPYKTMELDSFKMSPKNKNKNTSQANKTNFNQPMVWVKWDTASVAYKEIFKSVKSPLGKNLYELFELPKDSINKQVAKGIYMNSVLTAIFDCEQDGKLEYVVVIPLNNAIHKYIINVSYYKDNGNQYVNSFDTSPKIYFLPEGIKTSKGEIISFKFR